MVNTIGPNSDNICRDMMGGSKFLRYRISLLKLKLRLKLNNGVDYSKTCLFKDYHKNLLFIHVLKAAGISVVKSVYGVDKSNHATIFDYIAEDEIRTKTTKSFAIVRNPYDRLISAYFYLKSGGRAIIDQAWYELYISKYPTLDDFVQNGGLESAISHNAEHFIPQHRFIAESGIFYVDHIFKLERTEDLLVFLRENGVTKLEKINTNKAPTNKQEFYVSEKSKEIINRLYKTDFDLLDYKTL